MCDYIFQMIDYSFQIAFTAMRDKQDEIAARLEKELQSLATDDEIVQFIIVGICVGLVALSSMVIVPIFIWVIKDKSYVFAIFSYIESDEIRQIIAECKKLDLKNLRYKKTWLANSQGNQELFCKKIIAENNNVRSHKGRDMVKVVDRKSGKAESLASKLKGCMEDQGDENEDEKSGYVAAADDDTAKNRQKIAGATAGVEKIDMDAEMRKLRRKDALSEIE